MPRKPNYKFERKERDRIKAEKKAAKLKAKAERKEVDEDGQPVQDETVDDLPKDPQI